MRKYNGSLYKSRWDASTWGIIGLTAACCVPPLIFDDDGLAPFFLCLGMLLFVVLVMASVYYRIDGNNLVVYTFFIPQAYPIDKISEIYPIKTYLSAPATSLTHRIAIKFSDRRILKSTMPLVISPARQADFVNRLLAINPTIKDTTNQEVSSNA